MKRLVYGSLLLASALCTLSCVLNQDGPCADRARCDSSLTVQGPVYGRDSEGRVAVTAEQAWPGYSDPSQPLTAQEIAQACVVLAACTQIPVGSDLSLGEFRSTFQWFCATANPYEERVIPLGSSYMLTLDASQFMSEPHPDVAERWNYFVRQVLQSGGNCGAVYNILTPRPEQISCEEAGCWWYSPDTPIPSVECQNDVALFHLQDGHTLHRDCSRAYLSCDPHSPTGCSDRHPVQCEHPAKDRCDGAIKLGCDGSGRVSYHDCSRIAGGSCVQAPDGAHCEYPAPDDCSHEAPRCQDGKLQMCSAGHRVQLDCQALGLGTCVTQDSVAYCSIAP